MTTRDGGPAFPSGEYIGEMDEVNRPIKYAIHDGMTLRDWFAGQALAGYLASYAGTDSRMPRPDVAAHSAYEYADAMLAQREREED